LPGALVHNPHIHTGHSLFFAIVSDVGGFVVCEFGGDHLQL